MITKGVYTRKRDDGRSIRLFVHSGDINASKRNTVLYSSVVLVIGKELAIARSFNTSLCKCSLYLEKAPFLALITLMDSIIRYVSLHLYHHCVQDINCQLTVF